MGDTGILVGRTGNSGDVKSWRKGGRGSLALAAAVQPPTLSPSQRCHRVIWQSRPCSSCLEQQSSAPPLQHPVSQQHCRHGLQELP